MSERRVLLNVRLRPTTIAQIDAEATKQTLDQDRRVSRSEVVRGWIAAGLAKSIRDNR